MLLTQHNVADLAGYLMWKSTLNQNFHCAVWIILSSYDSWYKHRHTLARKNIQAPGIGRFSALIGHKMWSDLQLSGEYKQTKWTEAQCLFEVTDYWFYYLKCIIFVYTCDLCENQIIFCDQLKQKIWSIQRVHILVLAAVYAYIRIHTHDALIPLHIYLHTYMHKYMYTLPVYLNHTVYTAYCTYTPTIFTWTAQTTQCSTKVWHSRTLKSYDLKIKWHFISGIYIDFPDVSDFPFVSSLSCLVSHFCAWQIKLSPASSLNCN